MPARYYCTIRSTVTDSIYRTAARIRSALVGETSIVLRQNDLNCIPKSVMDTLKSYLYEFFLNLL